MAMTMGMMSMGTSSSWAATAVDKATSELLIGPDWTMNIDICDSLNSNHSQVKDVVKAVKKRLQHKNPKVQLLALTLLETMVKNCGDYVHFQIAEKNLLGEMVKIVRKKTDMHVRDKILVLLDSWQEAFGGPGGKHPQYYWAYEELRRSGVQFPQRSLDTAPIFTPPVTHPTRHAQAGYGMPSNSSRTLDETMAADTEGLSFSSLDSMRNIMELLSDMLQAVNPSDRKAVKDEIIVDLVERCRSNQKKLMQMLTTTGDEELLGQGLELNDSLQTLLAKHDAIASGSPMPAQVTSSSSMSSEGLSSSSKPAEAKRDSSTGVSAKIPAPVANSTRGQIDEDEEEEDEFAQLARRHSKTRSSSASAEGTSEASRALVPVDTGYIASSTSSSSPETSNALALPDPPAPVRTTKEQDIIDLLSITLSTTSTSPHPHTPHTPPVSNQNVPQTPPPLATQGYPYVPQSYLGNQGQVPYNSYVAPWARPQPQHQFQPPPETQLQSQLQQNLHTQTQQHLHSQPYAQPQSSHEPQWQAQPVSHLQPQLRPQFQSQYSQPSAAYPPPPWAATPGYANGQNHVPATSNMFSTTRASSSSSFNPMQAARPLQHNSSFPSIGSKGSNLNERAPVISGSTNSAPSGGQKPFIPSYRLFEDLNVFGNVDGKFKMTSSTSPSLSGTSGQGMVGGRK